MLGKSINAKSSRVLAELGVSPNLLASRRLPYFADASATELVTVTSGGKAHQLVATAAQAWASMRDAAAADRCTLYLVSAFRSFDRQAELVRAALQTRTAQDVFTFIAPPGCSEHHTGRALDLGTPEYDDLTETFAASAAFAWLQHNAYLYNFHLSFGEDNEYGFGYEPWHWCFHPPT